MNTEQTTEETSEVAILRDDFTLAMVDTDTGEILGIEDAPDQDVDVLKLIEWVGMRRSKVSAKLQGMQAEKADWIDRINRQYDSQIRHMERFIQYLDTTYEHTLREYARKTLAGQKVKTLKIAFLQLSFGTSRARVDVIDTDKAVVYCEKHSLADAIKIAKSVLKSGIPENVKATLTADTQDDTGLFFYPGGEETFQIK